MAAASVTFAGELVANCGFGYLGTINEGKPNTTPATCGVGFYANFCMPVPPNPDMQQLPPPRPVCEFVAGGVGTGFCGDMTGWMSGSYVDWSGRTLHVDVFFQIVGATFNFTGSVWSEGESGPIMGSAAIVPPNPMITPEGGSCSFGTATMLGMLLGNATFWAV